MFGKRRPLIITYFLFVFIFLLYFTGDSSILMQKFDGLRSGKKVSAGPEINSVTTEKLLMEGTLRETTLYMIESPVEGPTVMVIGGVHGDERAGYLAADSIANWAIDCGRLLVLPRANVPSITVQERNAPEGSDLNRVFPGSYDNIDKTYALAAEIFKVMSDYEPMWVIDLHEAEYCEHKFRGALGQTFIYPYEGSSPDIISELLISVNRAVYSEKDQFMLLRGSARGSAIEAAQLIGSESVIIETCMQMDLEDRIRYQRQAVSSLLYLLGITVF
ncbi:MAG: hypothetical protein ACQES4_09730 [Bacillota bacterium]